MKKSKIEKNKNAKLIFSFKHWFTIVSISILRYFFFKEEKSFSLFYHFIRRWWKKPNRFPFFFIFSFFFQWEKFFIYFGCDVLVGRLVGWLVLFSIFAQSIFYPSIHPSIHRIKMAAAYISSIQSLSFVREKKKKG